MVTVEKIKEFEELKKFAESFLATADELNEKVSAYIDGSDKEEDEEAYTKVKNLSIEFGKMYCKFWDEPFDRRMREGFNYELAESVLE